MAQIRFNEAELRQLSKKLVKKEAEELAVRANVIPSTTEPAATEPYYEVDDEAGGKGEVRVQTATIGGDDGHRAAWHEAKTQALQRSLS